MKLLPAALLVLLVSSPAFAAPAAPSTTAVQAELARGNNAFALDLYHHLSAQPGNLFFSPESLSTAFATTDAGARGQTAAEMARVFHFTLPPAQLHPAMGALLKSLNAPHPGYTLRVADALWAQQDQPFLPDYLSLMQRDYGAALHPVDFRTASESVRGTINQWVAQQTNDRIQNLIGPGVLTPQTRLVLANAIYFKGTWRDPFPREATAQETFHLAHGKTVQAPLMHRTGRSLYYDGGTFQALELPYASDNPADRLAMVVLLPKNPDGLRSLEQKMNAEDLSSWIAKLEPAETVVLTLPRFRLTQQFELSRTLAAMGMPQAFSGAADFSGMTGQPGLAISAAIHKAFVDVNEEGTEAAAATANTMVATAMRMPQPPIVFRADHPFLFLIRDVRTGAILFLGRLENPDQS